MFQGLKNVSNCTKSCDVKKSNDRVFKNDNIAKTETVKEYKVKNVNEISKISIPVKPETLSLKKELSIV